MARKNRKRKGVSNLSMNTITLDGSKASDNVRYPNTFALNGTPKHARAMRVLRENQKKRSF